MKINPQSTEIRSSSHLMDAEGSEYFKPTEELIKDFVLARGYIAYDIDISFDSIHGVWRWGCYLKPVEAKQIEGDGPIAAAFKEYKNLIEKHNKDLPPWDEKVMDWQTFYEGWQELTALQQEVERLKAERAILRDTLFQTLRESTIHGYTYCQYIVDKVLPPTK